MMSNLGPRANNAENASTDHNGNGAGGSGPFGLQPMRNVIATAVPRSTGIGVSNGSQSGSLVSVPHHPQDLSSMLADINSRMRSLSGNVEVGNQNPQGSWRCFIVEFTIVFLMACKGSEPSFSFGCRLSCIGR